MGPLGLGLDPTDAAAPLWPKGLQRPPSQHRHTGTRNSTCERGECRCSDHSNGPEPVGPGPSPGTQKADEESQAGVPGAPGHLWWPHPTSRQVRGASACAAAYWPGRPRASQPGAPAVVRGWALAPDAPMRPHLLPAGCQARQGSELRWGPAWAPGDLLLPEVLCRGFLAGSSSWWGCLVFLFVPPGLEVGAPMEQLQVRRWQVKVAPFLAALFPDKGLSALDLGPRDTVKREQVSFGTYESSKVGGSGGGSLWCWKAQGHECVPSFVVKVAWWPSERERESQRAEIGSWFCHFTSHSSLDFLLACQGG